MRITRRQSNLAGRRPAFTLLEVIFALALSLLLFGALLSAVEMYRHLSTAGRQDVEQAQLARAILRTMEIDIRSVVYRVPLEEEEGAEASSATADAGAGEEPAAEEAALVIDPAEAYAGQNVGISGDASALVIHANRPPGRLDSLLSAQRAGDLRSISYFLAVPGGGGLQGMAGDLLDADGTGNVQGLARLQGDRLAVEFADATANLDVLAQQTALLAAEVDYLQFRYSDGPLWFDAWDSVAFGRLPNSVEITIGIKSQTAGSTATATAELRASRLHRYVVAIPTAIPYIETATGEQTVP